MPVSSVSQEYPPLPGTLQTKYNSTGNGEGGYGTRPPSSVELLMLVSRHSWSSRRLPRSRTAWHWPLATQTGSTWRRPLLRAHVDEAFVRVVVFSTRLITTSGALLIGCPGRFSVGVAFRSHLKTPLWQGAGSRNSCSTLGFIVSRLPRATESRRQRLTRLGKDEVSGEWVDEGQIGPASHISALTGRDAPEEEGVDGRDVTPGVLSRKASSRVWCCNPSAC